MGKAKKGKKVDYDEDVESTNVDNEVAVDDEVNPKSKTKKTKKNKDLIVESDSEEEAQSNKKKNKKKGKDADIDEISTGVKEVSISKSKKDKKKSKVDDSDDEVEVKKPTKGKKKKGKESDEDSGGEAVGRKEKGGGFSLLAMSDDDADDDQPEPPEEPEEEEEEEEVVKVKKDTKKAEKGSKKSKKKRKDTDEEDLEKILAELELEYSGEAPPKTEGAPVEEAPEPPKEEEKKKGKKGKKKDEPPPAEEVEAKDQEAMDDGEEGPTVKTAAQKKKEKKEREKQKKIAEKMKAKEPVQKQLSEESAATPEPQAKPEPETKSEPQSKTEDAEEGKGDDKADDDEDGDDKKKKKKKKGAKEEKEKPGKPKKKMIAAMQEALKKINEMEEKRAAEEAERIRQEEEAEKQRQEQLRLEQERREKKKQKEKERKERLKAEGKLLSSKQKADRARAEAMLEAMKAMYSDAVVPAPAAKPKPFTKLKKKRPSDTQPPEKPMERAESQEKKVEVQIVDKKPEEEKPKVEEEEDVIKDSWDLDSSGGEEEEKSESSQAPGVEEPKVIKTEPSKPAAAPAAQPKAAEKPKPKEASDEEESSEEEDSESESETDSEEEKKTDAEKKRERAMERIKKRHEDAEKKKTLDDLRAGVVCVLGHVDTGKTKILDKLRRTNVQDGEAGGITQQIGATNVPIDAIKDQAKIVKGFSQIELKIPGLLIIDTPGHESFSNLRSRGSSLCDIAILVVDIMHGLEPQTIESINLLKQRKTPFVVALNKIDRLYDWQTMSRKDIRDVIKTQAPNTQLEFEQRVKEVVLQFAEQGLNAALFYNNPDPRTYVSLVPTSAITGEGMGNLLALIVEICQNMLGKRLMYSEELQATVLEVKALPGLGTTIDVILVNGKLREGDTIVLAGTEAPIVTQIRSLLMPQPLKELRVKNAYAEYKEIKAAQGAKIAGKDLEKVIAGLNLFVAEKPDEIEILKEEVSRDLKKALSGFKLQERGVYVQASTLGSLEALLEFLRTSSIPYANIRIGPVVKKDVMKASTMLEHDIQYAVILAFDVKVERDAQEMADNLGVKIFQADIIYHLFDRFIQFRDELKAKKKDEFRSIAVFPCKMRILPQHVYNSRDPIVTGVIVEAGIVKVGTPICVPSKDFVDVGIVTSIENNHKPLDVARKGLEVCVKIEPIPGESPKMFGRHFDETDMLISKISRQSIDACKDYFRDELIKADWQLMVELKKLFQIL